MIWLWHGYVSAPMIGISWQSQEIGHGDYSYWKKAVSILEVNIGPFFIPNSTAFKPTAAAKAHGRIIWDCAWSAEGDIFATASRDKSVKIWAQKNERWTAVAVIQASHPVTAVAFCPANGEGRSVLSANFVFLMIWRLCRKRRYLAIGLECGQILIHSAVSLTEWRREEIIGSECVFEHSIRRRVIHANVVLAVWPI